MRVFHILFLFVGGFTLLSWWLHWRMHGVWNWVQMSTVFFSVINVLISTWEIALWRYIVEIEREWKVLEARFKTDRVGAAVDLFLTPLSWAQALSLRFWTRIWSMYSLYDPSYSDKRSYGFFIDIGNGHSMLLPSLLWIVNVTLQGPLSPRWLGIVSLVAFYQMFYGTVLYFTSFFLNGRHHNKTVREVLLFVGLSNGIWMVFPLIGMWASVQMILSNTFACLV